LRDIYYNNKDIRFYDNPPKSHAVHEDIIEMNNLLNKINNLKNSAKIIWIKKVGKYNSK
jgi:hypothetical protein